MLTFEVRDDYGELLRHFDGSMAFPEQPFQRDVRLRYSNGEEIILYHPRGSISQTRRGVIYATYSIDMHHINYTIMNTNSLVAIIIDGEEFPV